MWRRAGTPDAGAAAVEFALISLPLFVILFGSLQYGFYFFQSTAMEGATREGARALAVGIADCDALVQRVKTSSPGVANSIKNISSTQINARGDIVTVRVSWDVTKIGFVPAPTSVTETATIRVERLGPQLGACDVNV